MGEIQIKSGNLCERYTSVGTAQQYSVSLYMFTDIQPSTTYTIAFEIDEGSLQYFNENLFTYSQYYVTGTGNKQILQLNTKANIQKTASTWSDTYGWIIAKNYTGNATVPHWKKIQLLEGTYTSETIPEYQPYFLNRPAHQYVNGEWIDIPTHHYTNGRWQGELTSQSPLKFRADGEMLDWRIDGTSGGVGDWDETEQKYKIPVRVEGENLFDGELEQGGVSISGDSVPSATRVRGYANVKPLTAYTITSNKAFRMCYGYNYDGVNLEKVSLIFDNNSGNNKLSAFTTPEGCNYIRFALWNGDESNIIPTDIQNLILIEGIYTTSTIPLYEVNIYTDHQLLDGDSIDFTTTETTIPLATGNNTLTVDTAVQPKSVFVKFEG